MQHIDDLRNDFDLQVARGDVDPEVERLDEPELSAYLFAWIRRYDLERF